MWTAHALIHLGLVAYTRGDHEGTQLLCTEVLEFCDATQCELDAVDPLHYLGLSACATGYLNGAATHFAETLARLRIRHSRVDFLVRQTPSGVRRVRRFRCQPGLRLSTQLTRRETSWGKRCGRRRTLKERRCHWKALWLKRRLPSRPTHAKSDHWLFP